MTGTSESAARLQVVEGLLADAVRAHQQFAAQDQAPLVDAAEAMIAALRVNGTILAFGNGGSAADAQHFAAELVGRFVRERRGLAALALSTDTSVLTSVGNDYGYERIFGRQVEALGRAGDVALAISTSGASANVLDGCRAARAQGLTIVSLTGAAGGPIAAAADIRITVPDRSVARVQEVHRTILHALCELVEAALSAA